METLGWVQVEQRCLFQGNTYLILNQKLDTFDRSGSGLGDGSGDTTHCYRESAFFVSLYFTQASRSIAIHHPAATGYGQDTGICR
jgi:hypothetical protein